MKIDEIVKRAEGAIDGAQESRKPKYKEWLKWELQRIVTLDCGMPENELLKIAAKYAESFTVVLATAIQAHLSEQVVEKQVMEIRLLADEDIKVTRQRLQDEKMPGAVVAKYKVKLEKLLWKQMERSAIATLIEFLLPCELSEINYHTIKVTRGDELLLTITRDLVRTVNRAFAAFPDNQAWASNFVSSRAIQQAIDKKRILAAQANRAVVGGSAGPWPR